MCEALSSHIHTGLCWWWRQGRRVIFWYCWYWHLDRSCRGLPLMNFLLIVMCRCFDPFKESMVFIPPSNWSAWWRWRILPSIWRSLFICTLCILCPHACIFVYHFFFLEGQGGVSGFSGIWIACVEENWRQEEYALSFWGDFSFDNVHFEFKPVEVVGEEGGSSFNVSTGFKDEWKVVYIDHS